MTSDDATTAHRERELKFAVARGWQLPNPRSLVPRGGSVEREVVALESTYFDTADSDLLAARVTLRRRRGDTDTGWQLKVPDGDARTEIHHPLGGRGVPGPLRELTVGVRGGAPLEPVVTLRTERGVHRVLDADGAAVAEIVVDDVTSEPHRAGLGPRAWREVEVELAGGDEAFLDRAAQWLGKHGARPAAHTSKLAYALDAEETSDEPATDEEGTTPRSLARRYLSAQHAKLQAGDLDLRRGAEAIRPTRLATRRYRSALRSYAGLFDPERAEHLDAELAWYASALGEVRDRQVLRKHLDGALAALPPELVWGPVARRIHRTLDAEEAEAREQLAAVMRSKRYLALMRELRDWADAPPFTPAADGADVGAQLAKAQRKVGKRLKAAGRPARSEEHDQAVHRARKAAKRARYAAELAEPALGASARRVAKRNKRLQRRLGERQDAVVAAQFLLRVGSAAGTARGENGFTFGLLYEREVRRVHTTERRVMEA